MDRQPRARPKEFHIAFQYKPKQIIRKMILNITSIYIVYDLVIPIIHIAKGAHTVYHYEYSY